MTGLTLNKLMLLQLTFVLILSSTVDSSEWLGVRAYVNRPDDHKKHVAVACEEDKLFLECNNRYNRLKIGHVFYGRDDTNTCRSRLLHTDAVCNHGNPDSVAKKVQAMCSGENRCKVPVTAAFLSPNGAEFCPHVRKYLRVTYSCHQRPHVDMTCHSGCHERCRPLCQQSCCRLPAPVLARPNPPPFSRYQSPDGSFSLGSTCPGSCPTSCAPLCFPSCCSSVASPPQSFPIAPIAPIVPIAMAAPPVILPPPLSNPMPLPSLYPPQPVMYPNQPLTPQDCPNGCSVVCQPYCPHACCTRESYEASQLENGLESTQSVQAGPSELELARRRSYEDMLRRFRAKQIAEYYG